METFLFQPKVLIISKIIYSYGKNMKPSYKPPLKRKYFHTERKLETKDATFLKKKIELLNQKKLKRIQKRKENLGNIY